MKNGREKSVVDYGVVRQSDLGLINKFEIKDSIDFVNDGSLIGNRSRLPNHKVLILEVGISIYRQLISEDKTLGKVNYVRKKIV